MFDCLEAYSAQFSSGVVCVCVCVMGVGEGEGGHRGGGGRQFLRRCARSLNADWIPNLIFFCIKYLISQLYKREEFEVNFEQKTRKIFFCQQAKLLN